MPNTDILLRELNHRVKNNFQIIVSLMNLKKRMLSRDRQEDIRFIEEHVQSMAVAYRLVYATGAMNEVAVGSLLGEVVSELRQIARVGMDQIRIDGATIPAMMGLDQAISLGLFLAVVLPPYLDRARNDGGTVRVSAVLEGSLLNLMVAGSWSEAVEPDFLRGRLGDAYAGQLLAERLAPPNGCGLRIRFPLDAPLAKPSQLPAATPEGKAEPI